MLLDLQLQRRARGTYATHHAATSTTAARSRIADTEPALLAALLVELSDDTTAST